MEVIKPEEKICHRFYAPVYVQVPTGKNHILGTNAAQEMQLQGQITNFPCIAEKCALWDAENKRCGDLSQAKALEEIARKLEPLADAAKDWKAGVPNLSV